jgi:hypothetical protein
LDEQFEPNKDFDVVERLKASALAHPVRGGFQQTTC